MGYFMTTITTNLLIDYLVMSFKLLPEQSYCFLQWLYKYTNFPVDDAEPIKSYYGGLRGCLFYKGIKIHFDNEMVILDMSGKGAEHWKL